MKALFAFILSLFLFSKAGAATLYFTSSGSGTRASTSCADTSNATRCPFSELATLVAGDTGIVKNGSHALTSNISLDCSAGASSGRSGNPVTVRAETERQALLHVPDATTGILNIASCSYWIIQGLTFVGPADNIIVGFSSVSNSIFKRNLFYNMSPVGATGNACLYINGGAGNLIEENEAYSYNHNCFTGNGTTTTEWRRNYGNPRPYAAGGGLVALYSAGTNNIVENNIADGGSWFPEISYGGGSNNRILGNISIGGFFSVECRGAGSANSVYQDNISINANNFGFGFENAGGGPGVSFKNNTVFNNGVGIRQYPYTNYGACSNLDSTGSNNLVIGSGTGMQMSGGSWNYDHTNVYGTATPFSPASADSRWNGTATTTNPALGSCRVYIPSSSPIKGAGASGADIGANVLYQYVNGSLTSTPLWDFTQAGANRGQWIARGATVAGVNDVAGSSLLDVHQRLGFGNGACPNPSSAGITLAITSPTLISTYTTTTTSVVLGGTSSGAVSIDWANDQGGNGSSATCCANWTTPAITLQADKVNTITIFAHDSVGGTTTATLQVAYSVPALVGAWAFDENGGTTAIDRSGKGNDGTFGAGVAYTTATVQYGLAALSFSGGIIAVPDAASLKLIGGWTTTAQVYPYAAHTDLRAILRKGGDYALFSSAGTTCANATSFTANQITCAPAPLSVNAWSCVATTYDGVNLKLYINKSLVQALPATGLISVSTAPLEIGNFSGFSEPFDGAIDNVRLYNYDIGAAAASNDCDTSIVPAGVANFRISGSAPVKMSGAGLQVGH